MTTPKLKQLRRSYGFDEVAIVPGDVTVNPDHTNIEFKVNDHTFSIPILAAAMDAVTDVKFAIHMSKLGGLAVLHLEGVQTRYDNPQEILAEIAQAPDAEVTPLLQKVYSQPIKENLIGDRIQAVKQSGAVPWSTVGCRVVGCSSLVICFDWRHHFHGRRQFAWRLALSGQTHR